MSNYEEKFQEQVIEVRRTTKVVKGGRRFRFSALVIRGDGKGRVGCGLGKANEVSDAIRKATDQAKRNTMVVPMERGTILCDSYVRHDGASVEIRRAADGTGLKCASVVRAIALLAGFKDLHCKTRGSRNQKSLALAMFKAFDAVNFHHRKHQLREAQNHDAIA